MLKFRKKNDRLIKFLDKFINDLKMDGDLNDFRYFSATLGKFLEVTNYQIEYKEHQRELRLQMKNIDFNDLQKVA